MRQWIGTVQTFNGRYWRTWSVRQKASSIHVAAGRAVQAAMLRQAEEIGRVKTGRIRLELTAVPEPAESEEAQSEETPELASTQDSPASP